MHAERYFQERKLRWARLHRPSESSQPAWQTWATHRELAHSTAVSGAPGMIVQL